MWNIIIDGAYFAYKTLYAVGEQKGGKLLNSDESISTFVRKYITDLCYTLRNCPTHKRVIITKESRSWRKDILIKNAEYKGTREKNNEKVNWDNFFTAIDIVNNILQNKDFIISEINSAEGDDLMYLWSNTLWENNESSIIITGDRDMLQCIKTGSSEVIVLNPNSTNRILYKGLVKDVVENDIFNLDGVFGNNSISNLQTLENSCKSVEYIDPQDFILQKIFTGDSGDDVPSIHTWTAGKSTYKISDKRAQKIINDCNLSSVNLNDLVLYTDLIVGSISGISKITPDKNVIKENIIRNIQLMWLDYTQIPSEVADDFQKHFLLTSSKHIPKNTVYKMDSILENTEYSKQVIRTFNF
jgi:5'-3' exonuclease